MSRSRKGAPTLPPPSTQPLTAIPADDQSAATKAAYQMLNAHGTRRPRTATVGLDATDGRNTPPPSYGVLPPPSNTSLLANSPLNSTAGYTPSEEEKRCAQDERKKELEAIKEKYALMLQELKDSVWFDNTRTERKMDKERVNITQDDQYSSTGNKAKSIGSGLGALICLAFGPIGWVAAACLGAYSGYNAKKAHSKSKAEQKALNDVEAERATLREKSDKDLKRKEEKIALEEKTALNTVKQEIEDRLKNGGYRTNVPHDQQVIQQQEQVINRLVRDGQERDAYYRASLDEVRAELAAARNQQANMAMLMGNHMMMGTQSARQPSDMPFYRNAAGPFGGTAGPVPAPPLNVGRHHHAGMHDADTVAAPSATPGVDDASNRLRHPQRA